MAASYKFGPFHLDAEREVLLNGTEPVAVGRRAVALLRILLEQPGGLISKDALIKAAWGGLAVEENNLPVQIAALRRVLEEAPGREHRIETLPRRGYRFVGTVAKEMQGGGAVAAIDALPRLAVPDRPSIAVLPFTNMSDDPARDYFADGITEDIITELSRFRWLFVIARNSTFTYKHRAVDVKQVGRELGVRYALEGSVRRAGEQVRITAQLIDAATGTHLWADRFDGRLADIFNLQDRVTSSVVGAIAPKLEQVETEHAKGKPTENLNAYDCYLRGMASFYRYTMEATDEALRHFYRAIDLDPDFAAAYGMAAMCYTQREGNRWMTDPLRELAEAARLARRAIELGRDDAVALWNAGNVLGFLLRDFETGAHFVDRARALNPNLASAWWASGWARVHLGDPEVALVHFAQAMRLSPVDPMMFLMQTGMAFAHFIAGRSEEAASWAERAWREKPNWLNTLRIAAASHGLAGHLDRAQLAIARLREIDPEFRVSSVKGIARFSRPEDFARYEEGLRKAGLPE
jgi:TolB-like protein